MKPVIAHWTRLLPSLVVLVLVGTVKAGAERLPIRTYTTADGLAHNAVNRIVRDSRGFLWFCTEEGLSRFDGYAFRNFGTDQGLPQASVNDFLETGSGEYWLATGGGLVRFNPTGRPDKRVVYASDAGHPDAMFTVFLSADTGRRAKTTTALLEGTDGTLWVGTEDGLYRLIRARGGASLEPVEIGMPPDQWESRFVSDLVEDAHASIWIAAPAGLYRRWPDGSAARYMPTEYFHDLLKDHEGHLWAATRLDGFLRLRFDGTHTPPSSTATSRIRAICRGLPGSFNSSRLPTVDSGSRQPTGCSSSFPTPVINKAAFAPIPTGTA